MKKAGRWHKIEVFVDKLIPYALVLLLVLIVSEVFFSDKLHYYSFFVSVVDVTIIGIFAVDLFFKYIHIKNIPRFIRTYFLEILALFPAFLIVRVLEEFLIVTRLEDTIQFSQEALEISQKAGLGPTRISYFSRLIMPLARLPRFLAAFHFYEKPTHRHLTRNIAINNMLQYKKSNKK